MIKEIRRKDAKTQSNAKEIQKLNTEEQRNKATEDLSKFLSVPLSLCFSVISFFSLRVSASLRLCVKAFSLRLFAPLRLCVKAFSLRFSAPLRLCVIAFVLMALITACAPSPQAESNAGNAAFAAGDYEAAITHYQAARQALPDAAEPVYNAANVGYRQGSYQNAQNLMQQALANADPQLAERAYYNLGNTAFQLQNIDAAIEAYKQALRINPQDEDARHNLELLLQMKSLQDQQQPQQQNQQDTSQGDNQSGQDQTEPQEGQNGDQQDQQGNQQGDQQEQQQQPNDQGSPQDQQPGGQGEPTPEGQQGDQPQDGQQGDQSQQPQQGGTAQPTPGVPQGNDTQQAQDEQPGEGQQNDQGEPNQQGDSGSATAQPQQPQQSSTEVPPENPQTGGRTDQGQESNGQEDGVFGTGAGQPDQNAAAEGQAGDVASGQQRLTEEQARQLLGVIGQRTHTLQEYLQQLYVAPSSQTDQDW